MIKITLPDKSVREYPKGVNGYEIAKSISNRLAKDVLSISVNNEVWDLTRTITEDSLIKLYTWDDREGKETFWHSSAHLMAETIELLFPETKFGIGPTVDTGFYYDVELPNGKQLTEKDLEKN
jgi:threonyl-tRNA synthetase